MKDTGPWLATAVANRDIRARIEKVSANAVTMWIVFGKDGLAGGLAVDRNGVDSSTATTSSSFSSAGGCKGGVVGDGSRSEGPGMVFGIQVDFRWNDTKCVCM